MGTGASRAESVQHSTVQRGTAQYSTAQYSTTQYSTEGCGAAGPRRELTMEVMLLKSMTRTSPLKAGWLTIWRALGACTLGGRLGTRHL